MTIAIARKLASTEEAKCYILILNDMRSAKIEYRTAVALFDTRDGAQAFVDACRVERWRDGQWGKTFAKGSLLEWFNEPFEPHGQGIFEAPPESLHYDLPENPEPPATT